VCYRHDACPPPARSFLCLALRFSFAPLVLGNSRPPYLVRSPGSHQWIPLSQILFRVILFLFPTATMALRLRRPCFAQRPCPPPPLSSNAEDPSPPTCFPRRAQVGQRFFTFPSVEVYFPSSFYPTTIAAVGGYWHYLPALYIHACSTLTRRRTKKRPQSMVREAGSGLFVMVPFIILSHPSSSLFRRMPVEIR